MSKPKKCILEEKLLRDGWFDNPKEILSWVMEGKVLVNDEPVSSSKIRIPCDSEIRIRGYNKKKYATRSGLKLEKALAYFQVPAEDKVCIDIGASEGGFTDCLLQNHARRVYAVDVAYGILNWRLRTDERVVLLERTNARFLDDTMVPEKCDLITSDVSFISITKIFPTAKKLLKEDGIILSLYKPQFELPREAIMKNGNVERPEYITDGIEEAVSFLKENGVFFRRMTYSPIRGNNGNIEFLLYGDIRGENQKVLSKEEIAEVTQEAFASLLPETERSQDSNFEE